MVDKGKTATQFIEEGLRDEQGRLRGFVKATRDITDCWLK
jgi:hypothetical protein